MLTKLKGAGCVVAGLVIVAAATVSAAGPLISRGIGTAGCERLAADISPAEGLTNRVNLALLAWVQGYVSAANVALLEQDSHHVDMNTLDETKLLSELQTFCKANPDKKPVDAIDDMIRKSAKVKANWEPGTVEWDE
jgi:hypothetical protein